MSEDKRDRDDRDGDGDERRGMPPWMVALLIVTLLGTGAWIVFTLNQSSKDEDCRMSGRRNCSMFPEFGR